LKILQTSWQRNVKSLVSTSQLQPLLAEAVGLVHTVVVEVLLEEVELIKGLGNPANRLM
jgi:hypothetical protein